MGTSRHLFAIAFAGLLGSAIGFFAGGYIGAAICDWNIKEAGCLEHSVHGAIIGGSILMPFGVQLTNWRRASFLLFLLTLLAVGGIAVVGLMANFATGLEGIIIAIPIIQLMSCVAIQWTTFRPLNNKPPLVWRGGCLRVKGRFT